MRRSNFALRLQPSLLEEARKAAQAEGVALNQLTNVAVAEKVSTLRTEDYFQYFLLPTPTPTPSRGPGTCSNVMTIQNDGSAFVEEAWLQPSVFPRTNRSQRASKEQERG